MLNSAVEFVRDLKRMVAAPSSRLSQLELLKAYFRLKLLPDEGQVKLFDYDVRYLDAASMTQLYREIFVNRLYDVPIAGPAPRIVDCGSNIGVSLFFFKHMYPDARIIGFEPHPIVYRVLEENVSRNGLQDVVLHQTALGDSVGHTQFFVDDKRPGALNMSLFEGTGQTAISVPTTRLSRFVDDDVDLLKLDVEGAEEAILLDLAEEGKLRRVSQIACEYHHHRDNDVDRLSATLSVLEQNGFGYHIDAYRLPYANRPRYQQDVILHAYRKH